MSAYTFGSFLGSLAAGYLITRFFYFLQKRLFPSTKKENSVVLAFIFFLTLSTLIGGIQYVPAALIIFIFDLYRLKSSSTDTENISIDVVKEKNLSHLTQSDKIFCGNCGEKIQISSRFCGGCGAAI